MWYFFKGSVAIFYQPKPPTVSLRISPPSIMYFFVLFSSIAPVSSALALDFSPSEMGNFPVVFCCLFSTALPSGKRNPKVYESTSHHSSGYLEFQHLQRYTIFFLECLSMFSLNFYWELEVKSSNSILHSPPPEDQWNDNPVMKLEKELSQFKVLPVSGGAKPSNCIHRPFKSTVCCSHPSVK